VLAFRTVTYCTENEETPEHINLTGDYLWRSSAKIGAGKFRPLRPLQPA